MHCGRHSSSSEGSPPLLYQVGREWAYAYRPPGCLGAESYCFPSYRQALCAALRAYCHDHSAWRLKNKVRTYRDAALLLGLALEPPSKAQELRALRESQHQSWKG